MTHTEHVPNTVAADLLSGVDEIAAHIGESHRRVYYLLERKMLPGFKLGARWYLRKSTLQTHIARLEAVE